MTAQEKLEAELASIAARQKKRNEAAVADRKREWAIRDELHRLTLIPLIGQPGAVMKRYRNSTSKIPDDTCGTLINVRRTRALVDFGEHGQWNFKVENLIAAANADQRGYVVTF